MSEIRYPIGTVARMTGLGLDRLRVWERRYRAVQPERGVRGRLYTAGDVQRLSLLREAVEHGHPIGEAVRLDDESLRRLLEGFRAARAGDGSNGGETLMTRLLSAVERLDYAEFSSQLNRTAVVLRPREVVNEVVLPLIRLVGKGWEEGRLSVAQEHMVSAVLRDLLGSLMRLSLLRMGAQPRLLFATPAGELHEFGILTAALLAAGTGIGAVYLGVSLPAAEIAAAAERSGARAVVLGVAEPEPPEPVLTAARDVARFLPADTELWIGAPTTALRLLALPDIVPLSGFGLFEQHLRRLAGGFAALPEASAGWCDGEVG